MKRTAVLFQINMKQNKFDNGRIIYTTEIVISKKYIRRMKVQAISGDYQLEV